MLKKGFSSKIKLQQDSKKVVLFLHCFRGNPLVFEELAAAVYREGYSFYNLRLPGHGCRDDDAILDIKKGQWEFYIENILLDLCDSFDEVYLCGLSLGATLALVLSKKYSVHIKKLILLSPVLRVKSRKAKLAPLIRLFKKKLPARKMDCSLRSGILDEFIPFFPVKQGILSLGLIKKAAKAAGGKLPPALAVLARNDGDARFELQIELIQTNPAVKTLVLEKSLHQLTLDVEKHKVFKEVIDFLGES